MKIAEIYASRQGEGFLTGTESVFIRTSGCNLRCAYCDTPYASWSPEGEDLAVDEIMARALALNLDHVVLTGGEPMLFSELMPLAAELHRMDQHVTIETAGTLYLPVSCDLMSISPKLSNSTPSEQLAGKWSRRHERSRHVPQVIRRLIAQYAYQFKFVVESPSDCDEVEDYLRAIPDIDRARVLLMPQGIDADRLDEQAAWLEPYCLAAGLGYCPRKQIEWFGPVRGT